jgi:hypothetical protein
MKSFGEWLHSSPTEHTPVVVERPAEAAEKRQLRHEVEILRELVTDNFSDLRWSKDSGYEFRCRGCDNWRELEDIEHYSPDGMYGACSERCIP